VITLQPITVQNASLFKAIRLECLQESPSAFCSTYARESQFTHDEWLRRIERWSGNTGIGYLAMDRGLTCGIAGALVNDQGSSRIELVSMWTAPTHRNRGIGRLLVEQIVHWASLKQVPALYLQVTPGNQPAIAFYERLGFAITGGTGCSGETEMFLSLPNHP
jgi:ribosomal protein S18 acetylase RimI-like enzyme